MKYRWNILIIFNSVAFFLETASIKIHTLLLRASDQMKWKKWCAEFYAKINPVETSVNLVDVTMKCLCIYSVV